MTPIPADDPVLASATFRVVPADLAAATRAQLRWRLRRPRILLWPLVIVAVGLAAMFQTTGGAMPPARFLLLPVLYAAGYFVLVYGAIYAAAPLLARWQFRQQPNLLHEWRVELSRFGLRAITPNQDSIVAWADYVGWSEDRRIVVLYQSDRLMQMMPARALGPDARTVFHSLVAHLPRR